MVLANRIVFCGCNRLPKNQLFQASGFSGIFHLIYQAEALLDFELAKKSDKFKKREPSEFRPAIHFSSFVDHFPFLSCKPSFVQLGESFWARTGGWKGRSICGGAFLGDDSPNQVRAKSSPMVRRNLRYLVPKFYGPAFFFRQICPVRPNRSFETLKENYHPVSVIDPVFP